MVARQRLGRDPRRRDGLDDRAPRSRRSARTTCCASRPATGSRSSTTTTSWGRSPGELRKVTVDDAARTITFTGVIPADLRPANAADAAARHLRVRRWDQAGVVRSGAGAQLIDLDAPGSTGLITVPSGAATQVVLEHGVAVSFSIAAGGQRQLPRAATTGSSPRARRTPRSSCSPPLRRSASTTTTRDSASSRSPARSPTAGARGRRSAGGDDCCDCTVCVTPESHSPGTLTIQDAVDQVKATGGTVCLAAGVYDVGPASRSPARARCGSRARARDDPRRARDGAHRHAVVRGHGRQPRDRQRRRRAGGDAAPQRRSTRRSRIWSSSRTARRDGGGSGGRALRASDSLVAAAPQRDRRAHRRRRRLRRQARPLRGRRCAWRTTSSSGSTAASTSAARRPTSTPAASRATRCSPATAAASSRPAPSRPAGRSTSIGNKIATSGAGIVVGADATVDSNVVNRLGDNPGTDGIVVAAGSFTVAAGPRADHRQPRPRPLGHRRSRCAPPSAP